MPLKYLSKLCCAFALLLSWSCAVLHHVQVGDVDSTRPIKQKIDVKLSESGVNLKDVAAISKSLSGEKSGASQGAAYLQYFQMGPKTGNPVYAKGYADDTLDLVMTQCPSGNISGLMSIRESTSYPVVSGEIIKITGWCLE